MIVTIIIAKSGSFGRFKFHPQYSGYKDCLDFTPLFLPQVYSEITQIMRGSSPICLFYSPFFKRPYHDPNLENMPLAKHGLNTNKAADCFSQSTNYGQKMHQKDCTLVVKVM